MKSFIAVALLCIAPVALAQSGHDSHKAAGVVKSVNAQKGVVTIAHEPIESLKWPGMTMAFKVKDPAALASVKPGQKVEFEFVQQGRDYVVTRLK
jgi:Cu(I)/Ag(I) efflux system protein CusF